MADPDQDLWDRAAADVAKAPPLTAEQRDVLAAAAAVSRARHHAAAASAIPAASPGNTTETLAELNHE
jgi:hypothetical protein